MLRKRGKKFCEKERKLRKRERKFREKERKFCKKKRKLRERERKLRGKETSSASPQKERCTEAQKEAESMQDTESDHCQKKGSSQEIIRLLLLSKNEVLPVKYGRQYARYRVGSL